MTFWVAGAVVVAGVGSALIQSNAASKAASAQQAAAKDANATQLYMYNQTRDDQAPWRTQGQWGLNQLQANLAKGFSPGDLTQDPGYQFELSQGIQGLDRSAASRGRLYSGAQMKAADTFATNFAGTKYNDAFNRWVTQNNELAGLAGVGQTATNATQQAGQNYANQYGQNVTGAANAAASGYIAQGNALSNALNQGAGAYMYYNRPTYGSNYGTNYGYTANAGSGNTYDPYAYGAGSGGDYSDARLKEDIQLIGKTLRGFNRYAWRWRGTDARAEGVIAQEVEAIDPSAVSRDADGFLMVDYSKV